MTSPDTVTSPADRASTPGSEWWRTAVIYQIYPRSFADTSGDGIGDLPGVTAHLDDLAELGVDAIWLSPFMRSPQKDAGYDVADYCDVDPVFGTLEVFDDLVAQAHAGGLRVVVDFVPKVKVDIVVPDGMVRDVIDAIEKSAKTGRIGDGKIFVVSVEEAVRIRTGERGEDAI